MAVQDEDIKRSRRRLFLACLLYAAIAGIWIVASDTLLGPKTDAPDWLAGMQAYKDWLFVAGSAALLYAVGRKTAVMASRQSSAAADPGFSIDQDATGLSKLQLMIVAASITLVLATVLLVSYGQSAGREAVLRQGRENAEKLAHVIEAQTVNALESVELTLHSLSVAMKLSPTGGSERNAELQVQMQQTAESLSHVRAVFVVNERGERVLGTDISSGSPVNFADQDFFAAHQENPALGLFISAPIVSKTFGKPFISVSRRIDKATGEFGGVIVAAMEAEYFQGLYAVLNIGNQGVAALYLRNGTLLVRAPSLEKDSGKFFSLPTVFMERLEKASNGTYIGVSPFDGLERIYSYRTFHVNFPLVVVAGLSEREILAGWLRTARIAFFAALFFVLAIALLTYALITQLKRREALTEALKTGEQLYRYMFDDNPGPMWLRDIQSRRILDVNRAAKSLYGYSREEFSALSFEKLYPAEDVARRHEFIEQRGWEADSTSSWRHIRKDGSIIDVEVSSRYFVIDGRGARLALIHDITERRRAEQALRKSEERYRYLFDANPQPMWIYDYESLEFIAVNDAMVNLYGYSRQELLSMSILAIRPEDDVSRILQRIKTFNPAENRSGIWKHKKRDGTLIYVDIVSHGFDFEGRKARLVLANDVGERLRVENALRDSEQRYRNMFDANPIPTFVRDLDSLRILAVNRAAMKLYGYTEEEFLELTTQDLHPPEEIPAYLERLRNNNDTTEFFSITRHRVKSGTNIDVEITSRRFTFEGAPARLSLIRDITDKIRAENAMRESELRLRTITDNIPALIGYVDAEQRYRFANKTHEIWYGMAGESCYGKTIREVLGDERYGQWRTHIDAALSGKTVPVEVQIRSPAHELIVRITYLPDIDAQSVVRGIYILGYDITERKKAEEALARERTLLRHVIDNLPDRINVKDHERHYLLFNAASLKARGVKDQNEIVGKTVFDFPPHELAAKYDAEDRVVLETGEPLLNREQCTIQTDGKKRWHLTTKVPLRDAAGAIIGIVGINRDITELKHGQEMIRELNALLEQRVIERTAQLESTNRELEAFSYSVSHDLRAPLRSIDGFSLALLEDFQDSLDKTAVDYLQRVRNASQRMSALIDDLLELSRITRREMHREVVDMSMLVQEIVADLRKENPQRTVDVRIAPGIRLQADANLMRIALDNLIRNAWKFTGKQTRPVIEIGKDRQSGKAVYFVRDNGVGFDKNYAGKLFGAFQRLHSETDFPGTGIGLATVQRVVRRHGGNIWAEAEPGKGATFFFTMGAAADS